MRVWVGTAGYDFRKAWLDSTGVVFDPRDERGVPAWQSGGANGDQTRPEPLASPIPWSRIERIDARRRSASRGATVGAWSLAAITLAISYPGLHSSDVSGFIYLFTGGAFFTGAVVGGAIGGVSIHSERLWERRAAPPRSE